MDHEIFQEVFNLIEVYLPEGWKKVAFFGGYTEGSYSMKFYIQNSDGKYVDCYNISGVKKSTLIDTFIKIDSVLSKQRAALEQGKKWTVFTMLVDEDGKMNTYYDYDNHSDNMISYEKEWMEKYLN
jgi:hypothetical protein